MKTTISIDWFDIEEKELTSGQAEELKLSGMNHATESILNGYLEGELHEEIDNTPYRGWWKSTTD